MGQVDIVLPVYRNRESLPELYFAVRDTLKGSGIHPRFVMVDDACPDDSTAFFAELNASDVLILKQPQNTGQQMAIRRGLSVNENCPAVVMDADLQDRPEVIAKLLDLLQSGPYDAVFATRMSRYGSIASTMTGRGFRALVRCLVRLPAGAGSFVAISAATVRRLNRSSNERFYLPGMIGCHAKRIAAIPCTRRKRPNGVSTYTSKMRWMVAYSNIRCILSERMMHERQDY